MPLIIRADLEIGRGDFDARAGAPRRGAPHPARGPRRGDLRRIRGASSPSGSAAGRTPTRRCATGWRGHGPARPPRSASGSAPRDCAHRRSWRPSPAPAGTPTACATGSTGHGSCSPSHAGPPPRPSAVTPNAAGWLALAEAEHERARGDARPDSGPPPPAPGSGLERPPLAAYCRWRQAEALVAAGAHAAPRRACRCGQAHAVAARIGAAPLLRELELLAERARLDLAEPAARSRRTDMDDPRADRRARPRCWLSSPAAAPTARSPPRS